MARGSVGLGQKKACARGRSIVVTDESGFMRQPGVWRTWAPEVKPVEMVWHHTRYANSANFIPEDIHDMQRAVTASLEHTGYDRSFVFAKINKTVDYKVPNT